MDQTAPTTSLFHDVSAILDRAGVTHGALAHDLSGMHFLRYASTTGQNAAVYRPLLCLVLQGAKEIAASTRTLRVCSGQSLIVSHAVPVVSRIIEATPDRPYVALVFPIDLDVLRGMAADVPATRSPHVQNPFSISLCQMGPDMEGALLRYLRQCEGEETRRLLAPITAREIHARLLLGPHAEPLRKLLWHETTASRIYNVTREIQSSLARPLVVGDLAERAGMSSSAFFDHFKAVTGTTPLQYQKDLRLLRAREMLLSTNAKVSDVGFGVGYESSAQFSREYARKFGLPPRQDRAMQA